MKSRIAPWVSALALIAALAIPGRAAAQHQKSAPYPYILVDLGTFGGPQSTFIHHVPILTNSGTVVGVADTTLPDPYSPNNNPVIAFYGGPDPYVQHGFVWHKGDLTDLGALPGTNSSVAGWINVRGDVIGISNNGTVDPLLGVAEVEGVLWREGRLIPLGTLGGYESMALTANDSGQIAGMAANTVHDVFSMAGWGTQTRAFLWQQGRIRDLGTLGGPDAIAFYLNARGQVAGESYTNATPNPVTDLLLAEGVPPTGQPTHDPFLWQGGQMRDLGDLGGTLTFVNWFNNRGEVVGQSNLAGDQAYHPYLWDGQSMRDLGTLGGNFGAANAVDDAGAVVGWTTTSGNSTAHAVLWRNGAIRDLGVPPGDAFSFGDSSNARGQVVGAAGACGNDGCVVHASLWQDGAMADLNTLVAPSDLQATEAAYINDRGEIVAFGALLIPARLAAEEGITSNAPAPGTAARAASPRTSAAPCATLPLWRALLIHRQHRPCFGG
jgi:probable HAF family extracellular repeat protein